MATKYIFVTGGVVSSLGKGLASASIGALLEGHGFKVALMNHVDEVDPVAQRVGAINTVIVHDGRWIGANTDVDGFLTPLVNRIHLKRIRASILGAGGAARAVAVALADQGAEVTICARRPGAAAAIADLVSGQVGRFPPNAGTWDVLVNTTTAGSEASPENPIQWDVHVVQDQRQPLSRSSPFQNGGQPAHHP